MTEIDQMDFIGFLRVRAWKASREKAAASTKRAFIDEVWPRLH